MCIQLNVHMNVKNRCKKYHNYMKNHDFVCTIWNFAVLISFSFVNKLYIYECRDIPVYEDKKIHKKFA